MPNPMWTGRAKYHCHVPVDFPLYRHRPIGDRDISALLLPFAGASLPKLPG